MKKGKIIGALAFILFGIACKHNKPADQIDYANLQHYCVKSLTDVIVYDIFSPPVASRIYAYANIAYHQGVYFKKKDAQPIAEKLKGFGKMPEPEPGKNYDFSLVAVKGFYAVAKSLIFSKDTLIKDENSLLEQFKKSLAEDVYANSIKLGDSIGAAIMKRAGSDYYKQTRGMARYSAFKEPGKWRQTPPDYSDAVEPNWSMMHTLLLDSATQCRTAPPPTFSLDTNSIYYKELIQVYLIGKLLTPEQDTIARYWDDNPFVTQHEGHLMYANKKTTPGGHWMGIVSILCKQTKQDEIKTAEVYALTASAIFDGFIACWAEKFTSRMVRPITVINESIDAEWNSLLQTPPFPEYLSGHSVISFSAATVITHLLGDNIPFHDTTEKEYLGLERSFLSVNQAASEVGMSRVYGGIHYLSAVLEGKKQGQQVGSIYSAVFK